MQSASRVVRATIRLQDIACVVRMRSPHVKREPAGLLGSLPGSVGGRETGDPTNAEVHYCLAGSVPTGERIACCLVANGIVAHCLALAAGGHGTCDAPAQQMRIALDFSRVPHPPREASRDFGRRGRILQVCVAASMGGRRNRGASCFVDAVAGFGCGQPIRIPLGASRVPWAFAEPAMDHTPLGRTGFRGWPRNLFPMAHQRTTSGFVSRLAGVWMATRPAMRHTL